MGIRRGRMGFFRSDHSGPYRKININYNAKPRIHHSPRFVSFKERLLVNNWEGGVYIREIELDEMFLILDRGESGAKVLLRLQGPRVMGVR